MGKVNGTEKLNLGGQEYQFELTLNAMINFEDKSGKNIMEMKAGDNFGLKDIRALLWAGLNENHDITIDEAGKHINIHNIEEVANKIMRVYENSLPEKKGEKQVKNKNRSVG